MQGSKYCALHRDLTKLDLFLQESVTIYAQELLTTYRDDKTAIDAFLAPMNDEMLRQFKIKIDSFLASLAKAERSLNVRRAQI